MINLKIDGKQVQIEKGAMILAAAERAGAQIPTLCYLKRFHRPALAGSVWSKLKVPIRR